MLHPFSKIFQPPRHGENGKSGTEYTEGEKRTQSRKENTKK
jgi:hypothetical protein